MDGFHGFTVALEKYTSRLVRNQDVDGWKSSYVTTSDVSKNLGEKTSSTVHTKWCKILAQNIQTKMHYIPGLQTN